MHGVHVQVTVLVNSIWVTLLVNSSNVARLRRPCYVTCYNRVTAKLTREGRFDRVMAA